MNIKIDIDIENNIITWNNNKINIIIDKRFWIKEKQ